MFCPFSSPTAIIASNTLSYAIYDNYPINAGYMIIESRIKTTKEAIYYEKL